MSDPLQCTFDDARRNHLRDGMALSTASKVEFFEEMVELAVRFGARDRLVDLGKKPADAAPGNK
jgi:hypothetical protein